MSNHAQEKQVLRLLQSSSCFRGEVCASLPCACAETLAASSDELRMLRERLGPRGLEVVEIDGAGHYGNEKVKAEIERLRAPVERPTAPDQNEIIKQCAHAVKRAEEDGYNKGVRDMQKQGFCAEPTRHTYALTSPQSRDTT